jgi:hypothetical protein
MQTPLEIYSPGTSEYGELGQQIKKILEYLLSSRLQENLFPLQIIFIFISVFFLLSILYFISKSDYLEWHFAKFLKNAFNIIFEFLNSKKITKKWSKIKQKLEKGESETIWKIYLLEALDILNKSVKKMGYSDVDLKKQLENMFAVQPYSDAEEVFRAQKVCENVIQNSDYSISKEQSQEVFEIFEKLLLNLKVL